MIRPEPKRPQLEGARLLPPDLNKYPRIFSRGAFYQVVHLSSGKQHKECPQKTLKAATEHLSGIFFRLKTEHWEVQDLIRPDEDGKTRGNVFWTKKGYVAKVQTHPIYSSFLDRSIRECALLKEMNQNRVPHVNLQLECCSTGVYVGSLQKFGGLSLNALYLKEPVRNEVTLEDIERIAKQILEFLLCFHRSGWVHGNLNLDSCVENEHRQLRVLGFKQAAKNEEIGEFYSIENRPPEVALKLALSGKSDLWALACLIFRLATKNDLFPVVFDENNMEQVRRHMATLSMNSLPTLEMRERFQALKMNRKGSFIRHENPLEMIRAKFSSKEAKCDRLILFLKKLLQIDPESRPSAIEALQDPFFTEEREDIAFNISLVDKKLNGDEVLEILGKNSKVLIRERLIYLPPCLHIPWSQSPFKGKIKFGDQEALFNIDVFNPVVLSLSRIRKLLPDASRGQ